MTPFKAFSRNRSKARVYIATLSVSGALLLASCSGGYETEEKVLLTKGLVTEIEEVGTDEYKITNETAIDDTSGSKVIAHHLSGKIDTLTMQEVREQQHQGGSTYHSHGMGSVLMHGMMGYYLGRSLSSPINPGVYRDQSTYNRVASSTGRTITNSAVRTTVRRPSSGSSGFGSGRSTRSFGG